MHLVTGAASLDKNSKSTKSSSAPHLGDEEQQAIRAGAHDLFMELDFYSSDKWKEGFRPRTGSGGPQDMRSERSYFFGGGGRGDYAEKTRIKEYNLRFVANENTYHRPNKPTS